MAFNMVSVLRRHKFLLWIIIIICVSLLMISVLRSNKKQSMVRKENGAHFKGTSPISRQWIFSQLKSFFSAYDKRPSNDNRYGSKVMHQFALWCIIKHFRPKHIIESGIYKGLGTWIIRQAAPQAQIILLDPDSETGSVYKDTHNDTIYKIGKHFQDFSSVQWRDILDPKQTLVFIDDHQYPIRRLQEALKFGFQHVIFDDNQWFEGDLLSLKQICGAILGEISITSFTLKDLGHRFNPRNKTEIAETYREALNIFTSHIDIYWEFPMIWHCTQKESPDCNTNIDNNHQLFDTTNGLQILQQYGLKVIPPEKQIYGFYNIVYVHLN